MRAVEQWTTIEAGLGDWETARLSFAVEEAGATHDAAAVLGPLGPGRSGQEIRFEVSRSGAGVERMQNLLRRLDRKRIWGTLSLLGTDAPARAGAPGAQPSLAESWDAEVAKLPPGWHDLLCELELDSTDYLPRAALLGAPLNPTRNPGAIALRFRASTGGYGVPAGMVRRCFERMDVEGITGRVRVLHGLSNTDNVATQGPVWRVAGRSV